MASSILTQSNARRAQAITLLVAGAFFMEMLDGTVIATALPQIGRSFGVSAVTLNIAMTAYLLALAVFIPISGWAADRFGPRTVFAGAIGVFTFSSVLCGLSQGVWSLTGARLLQGVGGAAMVPVGRLIVLRITEKKNLVSAMSIIVWPGLIAPVLAPPLGGFIVVHASWPWIFFLNVPLGLVAIALTMAIVPNDKLTTSPRPLDFTGFLLSGGALASIVYGADLFGNGHRGAVEGLILLGIGLALGSLSVRHFRCHPSPLLDLSPIKIPTFAVVLWGGSLLRIAIGALPFLLPLLFQLVFRLSPLQSGGLLLFLFAGNLAMKLVTTEILRRFGFRRVMVVNGLLAAISVAMCGLLTRQTAYWHMAVLLFASGAFRSMQFTTLATIQFADVPKERMGNASTLAAMLQQLTLGLGVACGAFLLNAGSLLHGHSAGVPGQAEFRVAFFALATIALLGLIDSAMLDTDAGRTVSGHVR